MIFYYLLLISSSQNSKRGNISCHFYVGSTGGQDYAQLMILKGLEINFRFFAELLDIISNLPERKQRQVSSFFTSAASKFQSSWVVKHYPLPCNNWQEQIATQLLLSPFSLKISHVTKYWRWAELCSLHHSLRSCTNLNCFYDQTETSMIPKKHSVWKNSKKYHFLTSEFLAFWVKIQKCRHSLWVELLTQKGKNF